MTYNLVIILAFVVITLLIQIMVVKCMEKKLNNKLPCKECQYCKHKEWCEKHKPMCKGVKK